MIDVPQIVNTNAVDTGVIHIVVPRSEIRHVMGPGLAELKAALTEQGITPAGPWFTRHLKPPSEVFDFEIGIPVTAHVADAGRVKAAQLPATTVARTIYRGGYDGLPGAWKEFSAWIAAQNRKPAATLWETYLTDPASISNPAEFQTELTRPLLD